MDKQLMRLANAAAKYAFEHDLTIPQPGMAPEQWSRAINEAVHHAEDHPSGLYANELLRADEAFARRQT